MSEGWKIAITGKGGVGKTTIAAGLAGTMVRRGFRVLAVDADPVTNLGPALGFAPEDLERITPIAGLTALIEERTGSKKGSYGSIFRLNPRVDDIPERMTLGRESLRLIVLGAVGKAGSGCYCPEHAFIRSLVREIVLSRDEIVLLDMEAGLEHLSRGTASAVHAAVIVVEPGRRSIDAAGSIEALARDLGVQRIAYVGNRISTGEDRTFIEGALAGKDIIGFIPYDAAIARAEREGRGLPEALAPESSRALEELADGLLGIQKKRSE